MNNDEAVESPQSQPRRQTILTDQQEITQVFEAWGMTPEDLTKAAKRALGDTQIVAPDDPESLYGSILRAKTVGYCLEHLKRKSNAWRRDLMSSQHRLINTDANFSFVVELGSEGTGLTQTDPTTKHKKGKVSSDVTLYNQLTFADVSADAESDIVFKEQLIQTYFLLLYPDHEKQEMRLELSMPRVLESNGKIHKYDPRYILASFEMPQSDLVLPSETNEVLEDEIVVQPI